METKNDSALEFIKMHDSVNLCLIFTLLSALCESLLTPEANINLLKCKMLHYAAEYGVFIFYFHFLVACCILMRDLRSEPEQWSCRFEHLKMLDTITSSPFVQCWYNAERIFGFVCSHFSCQKCILMFDCEVKLLCLVTSVHCHLRQAALHELKSSF